jgi:hypothetical protein
MKVEKLHMLDLVLSSNVTGYRSAPPSSAELLYISYQTRAATPIFDTES